MNHGDGPNRDWNIPIDMKCATLVPGVELQFDDDVGSVASVASMYAESDPFYDIEKDSEEDYDRIDLLSALSQHILFGKEIAAKSVKA